MNPQKNFSKVWLTIFVLTLIHSLFPPRVNEATGVSAGRSLILLPRFYQSDHIFWQDYFRDDEFKLMEYRSRSMSSDAGPNSVAAAWNPVQFDLGTYLSELIILLSAGLIADYVRKHKSAMETKNPSSS